jgi:hypothetical protein
MIKRHLFLSYLEITMLGILTGCSKPEKQAELAVDKLVFTKGTITFRDGLEDFPDSVDGRPAELYSVFKAREILKIVGRNAFFYINECGNPRRGYYRAEVDDSTINLINKYLSEVKIDDIIDPSASPHWKEDLIYDGYSYLLFLKDKNKTSKVDYIDFPVYKKQFVSFANLIDKMDGRLKLERLEDSLKLKSEFDSLKKTIVLEKTKDMPPLRFLPPVTKYN